jgi:hypothetical protein
MRKIGVVIVVAVTAAFASTAGTAKAGLVTGLLGGGCGATAPMFAAWGDPALYYFAPNGGFESGSTNWALTGGATVAKQQNEPWFLSGFGSNALKMPVGSSASINVCYGTTYPGLRFFASGLGGDAKIHVRVVSHSLLGVLSILDGGTFTAGQAWAPSPKISTLFSALAAPVGSKTMEIRITVESGTAQVDDLFIDPFLLKS